MILAKCLSTFLVGVHDILHILSGTNKNNYRTMLSNWNKYRHTDRDTDMNIDMDIKQGLMDMNIVDTDIAMDTTETRIK